MKNVLRLISNNSFVKTSYSYGMHAQRASFHMSTWVRNKDTDARTTTEANDRHIASETSDSTVTPASPVNPVQTKVVSPVVNLESVAQTDKEAVPTSASSALFTNENSSHVSEIALANRAAIQQFIDHTLYTGKSMDEVGRAWDLNELRRKSFDDLHKLYFILIKERNKLQTAKTFYKFYGKMFEQNERIVNCKKSMQRIKQVIKEREELAREMAWEEFVEKRDSGAYVWPIDLNDEKIQSIVSKYDLWTLKQNQEQ